MEGWTHTPSFEHAPPLWVLGCGPCTLTRDMVSGMLKSLPPLQTEAPGPRPGQGHAVRHAGADSGGLCG